MAAVTLVFSGAATLSAKSTQQDTLVINFAHPIDVTPAGSAGDNGVSGSTVTRKATNLAAIELIATDVGGDAAHNRDGNTVSMIGGADNTLFASVDKGNQSDNVPNGSVGTASSFVKIASGTNGGPMLADTDFFGVAVAPIGDLNGDSVEDLAVGASDDDTGGINRGAVYIFFMNTDGTVSSSVKIAHETNGGPTLSNRDIFGVSLSSIGDLNGDGVKELAVGAYEDDTGGSTRGAVYILFITGTANQLPLESVPMASVTLLVAEFTVFLVMLFYMRRRRESLTARQAPRFRGSL